MVCNKDCNKYFNCISKSIGHLSLPKECVTSGGLLSTNILRLGYNMATGHGPLSKVYKMEPQRQKNNDEQYGSGFNAVCVLMFWSHLGATVLIRKL